MKALEESNRLWEEKMKEQLIKDGYLGKDEKLEHVIGITESLKSTGRKLNPKTKKNTMKFTKFEGVKYFAMIPATSLVNIHTYCQAGVNV